MEQSVTQASSNVLYSRLIQLITLLLVALTLSVYIARALSFLRD